VVIVQIRPIASLLTISQARFGDVSKAFARGPTTVEAIDSESGVLLDGGSLLVVACGDEASEEAIVPSGDVAFEALSFAGALRIILGNSALTWTVPVIWST
jgi:hypothetical protein